MQKAIALFLFFICQVYAQFDDYDDDIDFGLDFEQAPIANTIFISIFVAFSIFVCLFSSE